MKLTFSWADLPNGEDPHPLCSSDRLNAMGVSPLAHALDDNGGLDVAHAVSWIDEGKRRAHAALTGSTEPQVWGREYWGLEFDGERGTAQSLLDPACCEVVPTRTLLALLEQWQEFLIAGPGSSSRVIEVDAP